MDDSPLAKLRRSQLISAGVAVVAPAEALGRRRVHPWFYAALARLRIIVATLGPLLVLYAGSYFATALATGAGWMEVSNRHQIVWTVFWPISTCAVNEPLSGPRYINDANGWFFTIGWQWFHQ